MSGYVPTYTFFKCRQDESFIVEQQRKLYVIMLDCWHEINERNLEQWININCCMKTTKSVSETLSLLKMSHGEYAMEKLNAFEQ